MLLEMLNRTHGFTYLMFWLALLIGTAPLGVPVMVIEYGWRGALGILQHSFLRIVHEEIYHADR